MVYHQAEQVSQCDWAAIVKGVQHPLIGRLITLSHCLRHGGRFRLTRIIRRHARNRNESSARYACSAWVNLSCWQVESVMSESTGSRSKMICSEMFVFCSGLLVSLAFRVSCQRSRLSEIQWLNVKQPTSTRLWLDRDRTRSQVKLVMSEIRVFCSSLSVSLAFETRHERVEPDSTAISSGTGLDQDQDQDQRLNPALSRGELTQQSHARDVSCPAAHLSERSSR